MDKETLINYLKQSIPFDTIRIGDKEYTNIYDCTIEHDLGDISGFYWNTPRYKFEFYYFLDDPNVIYRMKDDCESIYLDEENRTLYLLKKEYL